MKKSFLFSLLLTFIGAGNNQAQSWQSATGLLRTSPNTTKIGIGADNPQALLHILKSPGTSSGKGLLFGYYGNDIQGRYGTTGQYNGDLILNYWGGNVGIGTASPGAKLHVNEGMFKINKTVNNIYGFLEIDPNVVENEVFSTALIKTSGAIRFITNYGDGDGYSHLYAGLVECKSTYSLSEGTYSNNYMKLSNDSGIEKVYINNDGWAKFRNTIYSNGLQVNGKITAEEIEVVIDVPNFDHVFYENYELPSLKEVESYIKEQKHLMDIPSAKEFKENGYKVGEMDGLLLKKIEELTLYIIEQEKTIEAQREQLAKQEKSIGEILDKLQQN